MIIDIDALKENQLFITDSDVVDESKIKMKPAEFARLIGVSKQAVSVWIKDGKIDIFPNGYLNPDKAIKQLLKNTNPAKLRSRALMPLIKQVKELTIKNKQKEFDLIDLRESVEFLTSANEELLKVIGAIPMRLDNELDQLKKHDSEKVIKATCLWLEAYTQNLNDDLRITQFISTAPLVKEEGAGLDLNEILRGDL